MKEIEDILLKTFEKQIFDNESKKQVKAIAKKKSLDNSDYNMLTKKAFDLYRDGMMNDENNFLVDWLQTFINIINDLKVDENVVSEIKFSPINDCRESIINFIESAKEKLDICVFTISDNDISRKILEVYRKGVLVRIITDNEKQFDQGSDVQDLYDAGIIVKMDETRHHMHHKFAIADNKSLLTGSYNWTRSAAMYNQENLLVLSDKYALKKYSSEFTRLWKTSVELH